MLNNYRPKTPGTRHLVLVKHEALTRPNPKNRAVVAPTKSLLSPKKKTGGRDNQGHISCRHHGGGHKQQYRIVDFKRDKEKIPATVASIEYDPNRSAYLALLNYVDGEKRYILAPAGLKVGDVVQTTDLPDFRIGNCMKMKNMPVGSTVHNVELIPSKGGKLVRSAGGGAQLMARSGGFVTLRMPSGEVRLILEECKATLGSVSNAEHSLRAEGKAGRVRWKGVRPTVRGTAMNPVDHPHGGANGKNKGNIPQSPWAMYAKGLKTRPKKKSTKYIIKRRGKRSSERA